MNLAKERVILAVTGASGSCYAEQLLRVLLFCEIRTYVIFTETARKVLSTEAQGSLLHTLAEQKALVRFDSNPEVCAKAAELSLTPQNLTHLRLYANDDLYAPVASGSEGATHMVVVPSSMGTLARIAHGMSSCLIERAADVILKEKRPLIVVPRETPFNSIHLQNLLTLAQAGAHIIPAMPAFYQNPKTIADLVDFIVERIADALHIEVLSEHKKVRWNVRQL